MIVGKHDLTFDSNEHKYCVDGHQVPSVTQVLGWKFGHKYDDVAKDVLEGARHKGSELHNAIEMYHKDGLERADLMEFRDYKFLQKFFGFKVIKTECPVVIDIDGFIIAGTFDQLQFLDGLYGLADIKRTASLDKEYISYQLNLYKIGYEQCYPEKIDFLKAIHLRDGVRRYVDIPINESVTRRFIKEYQEGKIDAK